MDITALIRNKQIKGRYMGANKDDNLLLRNNGYTIEEYLNSGAFSEVYKVKKGRGDSKRYLAMKAIDLSKFCSGDIVKYLCRELENWCRMKHKNTSRVHEILHSNTHTYVFMDYASNGTVKQYLEKNTVKESTVRNWFFQIVRALKYCHRLGIAHRDIKCENLLLDEELNIKLTDFGFSLQCVSDSTEMLTFSESYLGTPGSVPPEILNRRPYDPFKADSWSLGVALFLMLFGVRPFNVGSPGNISRDELEGLWRFPSNAQKFSANALRMVEGLMEPDLSKRLEIKNISCPLWPLPKCTDIKEKKSKKK